MADTIKGQWKDAIWASAYDVHTKIVALCLADYANGDGTSAYPSVSTIAHRCSSSRRTVQRRLRTLEDDGWLLSKERVGTSTEYTCTLPKGGRPKGGRHADACATPDAGGGVTLTQGVRHRSHGGCVTPDTGGASRLTPDPPNDPTNDPTREVEREIRVEGSTAEESAPSPPLKRSQGEDFGELLTEKIPEKAVRRLQAEDRRCLPGDHRFGGAQGYNKLEARLGRLEGTLGLHLVRCIWYGFTEAEIQEALEVCACRSYTVGLLIGCLRKSAEGGPPLLKTKARPAPVPQYDDPFELSEEEAEAEMRRMRRVVAERIAEQRRAQEVA